MINSNIITINEKKIFLNNNPFPHIVIDNFIKDEYIEQISNEFPKLNNDWWKYCNPIEVKYAFDKINKLGPNLQKLFLELGSKNFINKLKLLTNNSNLEMDPHLHGAGLHLHPNRGRLGLHLDYEKHPKSGLIRQLNIILYLNREWKKEWNGATELWDKDVKNCVKKIYPKFNRAIIFKTNEISWHGVPEIINCPKNIFRKTLAYYYVSEEDKQKKITKYGAGIDGYRKKASFIKRPQDKYSKEMKKLYTIRPDRRITEEDMKKIYPDWNYLIN